MLEFDVVVVGSGPAAVAALHSLGACGTLAIVTGESAQPVTQSLLHPKIQSVAVESGEIAAAGDLIGRLADRNRPLISSASIGGFANYWGQQFIRFNSGDPWPVDVFHKYTSYEDACNSIAALFQVSGSVPVDLGITGLCGFSAQTPSLLVGVNRAEASGLTAMRIVFNSLTRTLAPKIFTTRARTIASASGGSHIQLDNGQIIFARRLFLAAGVVGNACLLLRSYRDIARVRFRDHTPWTIYTSGLRNKFARLPVTDQPHFNVINFELVSNNRSSVYASVYDVEKADLNLLIASIFGRTSRLFRRWSVPAGASFLVPLQIWTEASVDTIEIDARTYTAAAVPRTEKLADEDLGLIAALELVDALGARSLKVSETSPGYGFHYHALEVQTTGGPFSPIDNFLRERSGGGIICIDASILQHIGCRPHTLTAMAAAQGIVRRELFQL